MTSKVAQDPTKVTDAQGSVEKNYAAWKRAKVERGLKQAKDRDSLIPAQQVWREFNLEISRGKREATCMPSGLGSQPMTNSPPSV